VFCWTVLYLLLTTKNFAFDSNVISASFFKLFFGFFGFGDI